MSKRIQNLTLGKNANKQEHGVISKAASVTFYSKIITRPKIVHVHQSMAVLSWKGLSVK